MLDGLGEGTGFTFDCEREFSESKELARPSRSEKRDIRVEDDEQDLQMVTGEVARPGSAKVRQLVEQRRRLKMTLPCPCVSFLLSSTTLWQEPIATHISSHGTDRQRAWLLTK